MGTYSESIRAGTVAADTIRARRIELVDQDAEPKVEIYVASDDTPVVALLDEHRNQRLILTLSTGECGWLSFVSATGVIQLAIGIKETGEPTVLLYGPDQTQKLAVYIDEGLPNITMLDDSEKARLSLFLESGGKPYLMLFNGKEESQTKITVADDGSECLILEDREGEEIRIPMRAPREL